MGMMRCEAIGRLTDDPVVKKVNVGGNEVSVCEFSIAVNLGFGDNEKTEYINCVAWRKLAEIIGEYARKSRKVYVAGHQHTRSYDVEREGVTFRQYRTEWIINEFEFCDDRNAGGVKDEEEQAPSSPPPTRRAPF